MYISKKGIELLHHFEGCRLTAYLDMVGVPTIGYGHTKSITREHVLEGMTISQEEADRLFRLDLATFEAEAVKQAEKYELDLDQHHFDALVSFAFNLGKGNLRSMMAGAFARKGMRSVPERIMLYRNAGGRPVPGIIRRRLSESHLFESGEVRFFESQKGLFRKLASLPVREYIKEIRSI